MGHCDEAWSILIASPILVSTQTVFNMIGGGLAVWCYRWCTESIKLHSIVCNEHYDAIVTHPTQNATMVRHVFHLTSSSSWLVDIHLASYTDNTFVFGVIGILLKEKTRKKCFQIILPSDVNICFCFHAKKRQQSKVITTRRRRSYSAHLSTASAKGGRQ